jgi:hypothetical protein
MGVATPMREMNPLTGRWLGSQKSSTEWWGGGSSWSLA